jgi:hypothetical protein
MKWDCDSIAARAGAPARRQAPLTRLRQTPSIEPAKDAVTMILLADAADALPQILFWSFVAVILLVVMAVALAYIRKKMSPSEDFRGEGFTLADLRRLHKSGQMSDAEFERAKAKLLAELGHPPQDKT